MREIKFRAWDNHCKYFINFNFAQFHFDDDANQLTFECDKVIGDHGDAERFTFQQFTGLKDKNGKEIYEGDIYKSGEYVYEVFWGKLGFKLKGIGRTGAKIYFPTWEGEKGEVIGNIYENPELINK